MRALIGALLLLGIGWATSASEVPAIEDQFTDKEFVIVKSTRSFREAKQVAAYAAAKLAIRLDLRGLSPERRTGLTFSKRECMDGEFPYPCYVARGRYDDGTYASVEWSDAYEGFSKGLYLVMLASGPPGSHDARYVLEAARQVYPDSYLKRSRVYMGCMH